MVYLENANVSLRKEYAMNRYFIQHSCRGVYRQRYKNATDSLIRMLPYKEILIDSI